jgi:hypothetical protein
MPRPYWYSAWDDPWSCWNDRDIKVLPSTNGCQQCPMFRQRAIPHADACAIPPRGAIQLNVVG